MWSPFGALHRIPKRGAALLNISDESTFREKCGAQHSSRKGGLLKHSTVRKHEGFLSLVFTGLASGDPYLDVGRSNSGDARCRTPPTRFRNSFAQWRNYAATGLRSTASSATVAS